MKRLSKTVAIGTMVLVSAVFVATVIHTNENVSDKSANSKNYVSENYMIDGENAIDNLATLSPEEYSTYVVQSDSYLADIVTEQEQAEVAVKTAADTKSNVQTAKAADKTEDKTTKKKSTKYDKIAISVANPYVNVRKTADENGEILGKLYKGSIGEIVKSKNGWVKIKSGSVTGYVKAEYVVSGEKAQAIYSQYTRKIATVNTQTLRVRSKATTDSSVISAVGMGQKFEVVSEKKGWVKIDVEGEKGYVSSDYLKFSYDYDTAVSIEEEMKAIEEAKANEKAALEAQILKETQEKEREAAKKEEKKKTSKSTSSETKTTQGEATSYETDELKLLTCLVQSEAGCESYEGKLAVANVVLNRVKSSSFPNTISGVVYQSGQFGVVPNGALSRRLNNYTASGSSYIAARDALNGVNNIGNRKSFNGVRFAGNHSNSVTIGNHKFW